MTEGSRIFGDDNMTPSPAHQAGLSLTTVAWGVSRKLWLAFGTLMLVSVVSGLISYLYLAQIKRDLLQIVDVEAPLERAVLEMEINAIAIGPAVLDYVRERDPKRLDSMRDAEASFWRYAAEFERFAETDEERWLGQDVSEIFTKFKLLGDGIISLADQRHAANSLFRSAAKEVNQLLDNNLRAGIEPTSPDWEKRVHAAFKMESRLDEAIAAVAMYVAEPNDTLQLAYLYASTEFEVHMARYRKNNIPAEEARLLSRIGDSWKTLVRAGREIKTLTDTVSTRLQEYGRVLLELEGVLDNRIQPLIQIARLRAAEDAKSSTAKATLLLLVMGGFVLLIGGGSAWALSQAIVKPVRVLVDGTQMLGDGALAHRIKFESKDEFGYLATHFNRMAEKLQRALQSVQDARAHLERTVELRTSELNHELAEGKKAEVTIREAREAAEAGNRAKSVFLATMSHEIRTPLNGVIGMVDLLALTELNADQTQMIGTVRDSAYALLRIIGDVLDFSKIEAGELSVERIDMSISQVAEGVVETLFPLADNKNINLALFISPELPDWVKGDPVRIRQVLFNLVGNAVKFSEVEDGGQREVVVRLDPCAGKNDAKAAVRFTVADSGIGLSEDQIARLFTPFFQAEESTTRRFGGTGLGLSICKNLVDLMGGDIGVKSRIGEGATFTFELPLNAVSGPAAAQDRVDLTGVKVLLAFTNSLSRFAAEAYLKHAEAQVTIASGIADGGHRLSVAARNEQPYDVAIFGHTAPPAIDAENEAIAALRDNPVSAGTGLVILTADRRDRSPVDLPNTMRVPIRPLSRIALLRAVAAVAGKTEAAAAARENIPRRAPASDAVERRGGRILLAEDNAINQLVIQRQLDYLGYDATVACDGVEALRRLDQEKFSLLLTDCHMPNMDGFELTEEIRKRERDGGRRLPIVAITATAMRGDAEHCLAAGMDDFLSKPVELAKLSETLEKWMSAVATDDDLCAVDAAADSPRQRNGELDARENGEGAEPAESKIPVDLATLSRLLGTDDEAYLKEMLSTFWDTMATTPVELRQFFSARDAGSLRDAAHAAKGASASVGADLASSLLSKLQIAAADANWRQIEEIMPEIDAAFVDLERYIGSLKADSVNGSSRSSELEMIPLT